MAIPKAAKPIPLPVGGRAVGRKSQRVTAYGLDKDPQSQLYILAGLHYFRSVEKGRYPGFRLNLSETKELFNYPEEADVMPLTFKTNANTSLRRRGPQWLKLGHRTLEDVDPKENIDIVFRHNEKTNLPSVGDFSDANGINMDDVLTVLELGGFEEILDEDWQDTEFIFVPTPVRPKRQPADNTGAAPDEEPADEPSENPDPEPELDESPPKTTTPSKPKKKGKKRGKKSAE